MAPLHLSEGGYFFRLVIALALGVLIGLEREWRQRQTGLHTTAMVAAGAAIFAMIAPLLETGRGDPTRIAAQVVSGIGFLAGGVILRQGANVRGLTTAATLWATAGIGVLAGFGFVKEAAGAAVLIVIGNLLLYPLARRVDSIKRDTRGVMTIYTVSVACEAKSEMEVRDRVVDEADKPNISLESVNTSEITPESVMVRATLLCTGRDDRSIEALGNALKVLPGVISTNWRASQDFT